MLFVNVTPLVDKRGAGTSPAAHRKAIRRPSMSHVLIALAVVLAFAFNFLALQDRGESTLVAVAAHPIDAGARVEVSDIRWVDIDAGFEGLATLVDEARWESLAGWVAARPIPEGGVLGVDDLARPAAGNGLRSMSVPVPIEHAAGGLIETGDSVDVISVGDAGPYFVVSGVTVLGKAADPGSGIGNSGGFYLVLAVDEQQALLLAAAIDSGSVEVVRSTGAQPVEDDGDA